jgi:hypothetical protein
LLQAGGKSVGDAFAWSFGINGSKRKPNEDAAFVPFEGEAAG